MYKDMNTMKETPDSSAGKLESLKATIAETMEKLAVALDRTIDSMGEFGIKIAEQIKQLGEKFKEFLLADKEIILHNNLRTMLQELNKGLDTGDTELVNNPQKIYGFLQEVSDAMESRLSGDMSYQKNFAFLYTEDIQPEITEAVSKLRIAA